MLLQAARRALRPRPDGALSGGVDFRDASDHGASVDTRCERHLGGVIAPNSRKDKDKSERLVTCFVRVPGMCEARPRYQLKSFMNLLSADGLQRSLLRAIDTPLIPFSEICWRRRF
jgi:hypothetical protein